MFKRTLFIIATLLTFTLAQVNTTQASSSGCQFLNGFSLTLNSGFTYTENISFEAGEIITVEITVLAGNFQEFSVNLDNSTLLLTTAEPGTYVINVPYSYSGDISLTGVFDAVHINTTCTTPDPNANPNDPPPTLNIGLGSHTAALFINDDADGNPRLDIYDVDANSNGSYLMDVTQDDIAPYIGNPPATNTLIESAGFAALYVLTTGEFQLNIGPDDEGKTYVIIFDDIPPSTIYGYVIEP